MNAKMIMVGVCTIVATLLDLIIAIVGMVTS